MYKPYTRIGKQTCQISYGEPETGSHVFDGQVLMQVGLDILQYGNQTLVAHDDERLVGKCCFLADRRKHVEKAGGESVDFGLLVSVDMLPGAYELQDTGCQLVCLVNGEFIILDSFQIEVAGQQGNHGRNIISIIPDSYGATHVTIT